MAPLRTGLTRCLSACISAPFCAEGLPAAAKHGGALFFVGGFVGPVEVVGQGIPTESPSRLITYAVCPQFTPWTVYPPTRCHVGMAASAHHAWVVHELRARCVSPSLSAKVDRLPPKFGATTDEGSCVIDVPS